MLSHGSAISAGPLLDFYFNCNTGILLFFHLFLVWFFFLIYLVIPLQVPVVPSHLVRDSWVLSLVHTGSRFPLQGQVLPVGVRHPTSDNNLSGSSMSPGRSLFLAPSTFGGKVSVWWEWRQWCLCNSCTRICQHGSQDASRTAWNRCPSVTPLLITGCVCMDLKPGYFHMPQLERLEKTFTSADAHTKEILAGYHHHDLAASFFLHGFSFLCKFLFLWN